VEPILTVRQPWASAIFHAGKTVENRPRRTHYRGRLWIHAGEFRGRDEAGRWANHQRLWLPEEPLPRGVILGSVQLVDCIDDSDSPWASSRQLPLGAASPDAASPPGSPQRQSLVLVAQTPSRPTAARPAAPRQLPLMRGLSPVPHARFSSTVAPLRAAAILVPRAATSTAHAAARVRRGDLRTSRESPGRTPASTSHTPLLVIGRTGSAGARGNGLALPHRHSPWWRPPGYATGGRLPSRPPPPVASASCRAARTGPERGPRLATAPERPAQRSMVLCRAVSPQASGTAGAR
jgi:hypothetical protein